MARPLVVGIVHTGVDMPLGLHAVAQAVDVPSVRLPLSSVEPVYGLSPDVPVSRSDHYPDRGRPASRHEQHRGALQSEHISPPVRLPGQHPHPPLRRPPRDGLSGRAGSSA
jgi:hypothetical protein